MKVIQSDLGAFFFVMLRRYLQTKGFFSAFFDKITVERVEIFFNGVFLRLSLFLDYGLTGPITHSQRRPNAWIKIHLWHLIITL